MRNTLILTAILTVLCAAAQAADPPPANTVPPPTSVTPLDVPQPLPPIVRGPWLRRPTGADVANYYPLKAAEGGISGHVMLVCKVANDGRLTGCTATAVTPPDQNFEWAALKLAPDFRLDVKPPKGDPTLVGTEVSVPINWAIH